MSYASSLSPLRTIIPRYCLLFTVAAALSFMAGCGGGGGNGSTAGGGPNHIAGGAYAAQQYRAAHLPLTASKQGDFSLSVTAGGTILGTLTVSDATAKAVYLKAGVKPRISDNGLSNGVSGFTGYFTGSGGDFSALLSSGPNAPGTVTGTFPNPPSISGGTFTITLNGNTYGPYPFNNGATTPPVVTPPVVTPPGTSNAKYDLALVGVLPGASYSQAFGLNDRGQIVGASDVNQGLHAFLWDANTGIKDLNIPNAQYAGAFDINNAGEIVGRFTPTNGDLYHPHVFVINGAGVQDIGLPNGFSSLDIEGVTEDGQVIAEASYPNNSGSLPEDSVSYYGGAFHDIGPAPNSEIIGYNRSGVVIGRVYASQAITQFYKYLGHSTSALTASDFKDIGYYATVRGAGVGPNGEILSRKGSTGTAAIFSGGSVIDLGVKGLVMYLNSRGEAVGNSDNGPFYWTQAGGLKYLQALIDPASGFTLGGAVSINNNGQIACSASSKQYRASLGVAVLLTPRP